MKLETIIMSTQRNEIVGITFITIFFSPVYEVSELAQAFEEWDNITAAHAYNKWSFLVWTDPCCNISRLSEFMIGLWGHSGVKY